MGHLVKLMSDVSIAECYCAVKDAHDYLAQQGAKAIELASRIVAPSDWASKVKRLQFSLPQDARPKYIDIAVTKSEHNLTEVMNQCATMERLLDALAWAQTDESGLAQFHVVCCHPTTSSARGDNDLVLLDSNGQYARFEMSDIVSDQDGNGKEKKDLTSLGIWQKETGWKANDTWPAGRMFLVVSREFAQRLRKANSHGHYFEMVVPKIEQTCIFEIKSV